METYRKSEKYAYEHMLIHIMSAKQLNENSYPRPTGVPGVAEFNCSPPLENYNTSTRKICDRCKTAFAVQDDGRMEQRESCIYHAERPRMQKIRGNWVKIHKCCQKQIGSGGCTVAPAHVHCDNKLNRTGYVQTRCKTLPANGNAGIYAVDCEMSYTTDGLELTQVSIIDHNCKLVYSTFVKPYGDIIDYNTRWSGVTEKSLENVTTTLRDVQDFLLSEFSAKTILIGQSLESDFVALRLLHETVVDTSIAYPHKRGWPYKRALRDLAFDHLGIVIQAQKGRGHDSTEDAKACIRLMMKKIGCYDMFSGGSSSKRFRQF